MRILFVNIIASLLLLGTVNCKNPHPLRKTAKATIPSSGIPAIPDSLFKSIARYQNWRPASVVDWAPGGRGVVIIRRADETNQLFLAAGLDSTPQQLTSSNESVLNATVCPDSSRKCVLFTRDSGGNENFQIYRLDLDSLRTQRLTRDSAQNSGMVWSNHGDRFAFASNRRNGTDIDIYISDIARPGHDSLVLRQGGSWSAVEWSPDDKKLIVSRYTSRTLSQLYLFDLATGALRPLHQANDAASEELGAWAAAGKGVFYTSDLHTDFRCLRYCDLVAKNEKLLTSAIRWDVREIALSRDKRLLAFTTNENGFSRVYLMDTRTFAYRQIPNLPQGIIGRLRFNASGDRLAMSVETPQKPDDVYSLSITDRAPKPWNLSEFSEIDTVAITGPKVFQYPTFDSAGGKPRLIPCLMYKPLRHKPPFPVLITLHGGPESQFWPAFKPEILFQVNELGIAVLAPNVRGSGGYGKTWLTLDNGYSRENAVLDVGALLSWISTQPDLDSSRIAVTGASYGGYLSLASMAFYHDKFRAAIDCYGISNFITFLEHTAPYRRDLRRVEYGDERDSAMRAFLTRISPVTSANVINKPLLIIQGANDARVPLEESQQIAEAVRKNGSPVWFLVAGDEGHGFRRKANRDYQDCVTAMFLERFLINQVKMFQ